MHYYIYYIWQDELSLSNTSLTKMMKLGYIITVLHLKKCDLVYIVCIIIDNSK